MKVQKPKQTTRMEITRIAWLLLSIMFFANYSLSGQDVLQENTFSNPSISVWYRGYSPSQEIVKARTMNSKVFAARAKLIHRIFAHPVHFVNDNGILQDLPETCMHCRQWQVGESYSGYVDGLFEETNVCGQSATYIQVNDTYFLRGFVEFNTEAIPDTTIIDSLELYLFCSQWPIYDEDHDIWSMESKPSNAAPMTIYNDAVNGNCYVSNYLGGSGWNSWDLDSIACQNLQDLLTDDWFAIGISGFYSASAYYLLYQCGTGYIDVIELGIAEEKPRKAGNIEALDIKPNPFSGSTRIRFTSPSRGHSAECLDLHIYDIAGREVMKFQVSPSHSQLVTEVVWNGRDDQGNPLPSGTYFCKLNLKDAIFIKKMIFIR